ncbi:Senescence/spartin-associated, C-terminal [Dillenia turbinata]|uniref:Senescence/spartin-associated, C-terminal n=1 Tax=Dillenia turbinata TaxID=194707 RepID=A0AAN8V0X9_9MAGN
MTSQNPNSNSLYPKIDDSNPNALNPNPNPSSSQSLYPQIDTHDLVENLFPDPDSPSAPPEPAEEVLLKLPGAILNLIDKNYSVTLACGDLMILRIKNGDNVVAVLARVSVEIQWPLAKDCAVVKVDDSHYFFSLCVSESNSDSDDDGKKMPKLGNEDFLNYGLTVASKGQENLLVELDKHLEIYSSFTVQKVSEKGRESEVLDVSLAKETAPSDLKTEKKETMEKSCVAYWTTLAPNVEDYSGKTARLIAAGSGQLIKGILWCGDVTVDRLKWGEEVLKKKINPGEKVEISPETLKRIKSLFSFDLNLTAFDLTAFDLNCLILIERVGLRLLPVCCNYESITKHTENSDDESIMENDVLMILDFRLSFCGEEARVKRMTKMTEKVAVGILSGVVKVSGFFTSSAANSKPGKKFFGLLPGEIVLASLDGFNKICDAVEVSGRNVMSTSSTVTTGLVSHKYGGEAAKATSEGLDAAGHAMSAAWAVFKIRKGINPKCVLKPLAKSGLKAAAESKKKSKGNG